MALQKTMGTPNFISKKVNSDPTEESEHEQNLLRSAKRTKSDNLLQTQPSKVNQTEVSTHNKVISSNNADTKFTPNFQFSVRSEKGLNLVVDLNSSQADWIKKLNDGVHVEASEKNPEKPDKKP